MRPEPKAPPASAPESEYQAFLADHQAWTRERAERRAAVTDDSVRDTLDDLVRERSAVDLTVVPIRPDEPAPVQAPDLDTWWLPGPARDWCDAAAEAFALPKTLPVAACICAMATALQGRTTVIWKTGVEEPLSLYWLVFSATGSRKSALLKACTAAIVKLELELKTTADRESERINRERQWRERQLSNLQRRKAPQKHTPAYQEWRAQMKDLELELEKLVPPRAPKWLRGDVNPSLLPKLMRRNHEAEGIARISALVDEGTIIENLLGRHQGAAMLETVLGALNGAPISWVRASNTGDEPVEVELPHSHMTICALIQPHFYGRLAGMQLLKDNGFLGRCLMHTNHEPPRRPAYASKPIPDAVQEGWDALLLRLLTADVPETIDLTIDAAERQAVNSVYDRVEVDGTGWSQRIVGLICRIVAICEVGEKLSTVDPKTVDRRPTVDQPVLPSISSEYDWLDDEKNCRPTVDQSGGVSTTGMSGPWVPRTVSIIDHLYTILYVPHILAVRAVDQPGRVVSPTAPLYTDVCARLGRPKVSTGTMGHRRLRDLHRTWKSTIAPSSDELYRCLELAAEQGRIEWVASSERKNRGERRYTEYVVLDDPAPKGRKP